MADAVRFQLLGPVTARTGDRLLELGPRKQCAVLAVLLLGANRPVSTNAIVDAVWGERPPADGPNVVSKYVGRLRRLIEPEPGSAGVFDRTAAGYLVRADSDTLDVAAFDAHLARSRRLGRDADPMTVRDELRAALDLWQGPALAGLDGAFFDAARTRLAEQRIAAIEERIDLDLAQGPTGELVVELTGLVADHPLRERLAGQLMLALHRADRQADALGVFRRLRARLADELGIDPGREITTLHDRILRNDTEPPTPTGVGRRADRSVPSQLRHDLPDFTGRTEEITELTEVITRTGEGAVTVCAIDGTPGIGKTALALHLAHRVADRFPDGQLHVDLRGFDPELAPLAPTDALGQFLRALGVAPPLIPVRADEQAALYRSVLAGRRLLLLLDNAVSPQQVRPLLPGTSSSLVLVTSRQTLAGLSVRDGAHRITLGALSDGDAVALLRRIVGSGRVAAQPGAAVELARLCGHLPLALRIAGQRAAGRPALTLADLVAELHHERDRLDVLATEGDDTSAVRAVFSWSYDALDEAAARAFRLLGLHATPEFGLPVAAVLTGTGTEAARRLIARLIGAHLLQDNGKGRYQFHDLMRVYAAERAVAEEPAAERGAAVRRVLAWYLHTANAAGAALVPNRPRPDLALPEPEGEPLAFGSVADALAWYEAERANLLAAHRQAVELDEHAAGWQLPVTMWDFFTLRSQWADWIGTHELGLDSARATGDLVGQAGVLTSLGHAYLEVGRLAESLEAVGEGLALWRRVGHRWGEGIALHLLGSAEKDLGRFEDCVEHYRQALAVHAGIDNRWGLGWTLAALGTAHKELGEYGRALDNAERAMAIWREIGDRYGEGFALNDLGDSYLELGRFGDAVAHYRQGADLNRLVGNRWGEAWALRGLGDALDATDDTDVTDATGRAADAVGHWRQALVIFQDLGDPRAEVLRARLAG